MTPLAGGDTAPTPVHVLVITADPAHAAAVETVLGGWPVPATVEIAAEAHAAVGSVLLRTPDLAVLDAELDGTGGHALRMQLLRVHPQLGLVVFERQVEHPGAWPTHAWPWSAVTEVLDAWLHQHLSVDPGLRRPQDNR